MNLLLSSSGLLGFWLAIYYLWRDLRYDAFREDIFSVRDELFLWAAQGNIEFSNPAYSILRNRMNALLRHGHDLTLTRAILLFVTHKEMKSPITVQWEQAVETLPTKTRETMNWYNLRIGIFVLQHLLYCSFLRYLMFRPFITSSGVQDLIAKPAVATGVQRLESKTIEEDERTLRLVATA